MVAQETVALFAWVRIPLATQAKKVEPKGETFFASSIFYFPCIYFLRLLWLDLFCWKMAWENGK